MHAVDELITVRPLVMLLWTGGVDDSVFEKLMSEALESTTSGMKDFFGAAKQLISNRLGHPFRLANTFHKLSRLELELDQPGVHTSGLQKILNSALYHIKRDLKHKARIEVPGSYTLVGVCDEDNYLRPRQIYGMSFFVIQCRANLLITRFSLRSTF
jgi:RNA-dependent RNA polymerase